MKRWLLALLLPLMVLAFTKSVPNPELLGGSKWCEVCGMDLAMFYKTNHAIELDDGTKKQYCSIHCLAAVYPQYKAHIKKILAVDAATGKWIDATKAWYVVGSDVPGTMSPVSKLAFASKADAEAFAKAHGGKIMTFDQVFAMAQKSLEKENAMIERKKRQKMYPMGKMLYQRHCKEDIKRDDFENIARLKDYIVKKCPELQGKKLQAVALYVWEAKDRKHIAVPKDAKCPVCGMFVAKYPRWAAMVVDKEGRKLYFDGVKDMLKYYFSHPGIKRLYATDYYTGLAVDATKAYYVVGSDVYGPMGNELIPFEKRVDAEAFAKDHGGRIVTFEEIDKELVSRL